MAEKVTHPPMRRAVFAATLARLVGQPRFDRLRGMPLLHRFAGRKAMQTPDPVCSRYWRSTASARPQCGPVPRALKSASRRRTRLPPRYCARHWLRRRAGAGPID